MLQLRDEILRRPLGLSLFDEPLQEAGDIHIAAFLDGCLVGTALLRFVRQGVWQIKQVAVAQEHQNRGIGSALMRYVIALAKQRGFCLLQLHARQSAVEFYRRLGFGVQGKPFVEVGICHVAMQLPLTQ